VYEQYEATVHRASVRPLRCDVAVEPLRPDAVDIFFVDAVEERPRLLVADVLDLLKVVEEPANL